MSNNFLKISVSYSCKVNTSFNQSLTWEKLLCSSRKTSSTAVGYLPEKDIKKIKSSFEEADFVLACLLWLSILIYDSQSTVCVTKIIVEEDLQRSVMLYIHVIPIPCFISHHAYIHGIHVITDSLGQALS